MSVPREAPARVGRLEAEVRDYAWGSRTAVAALRGRRTPSDRPQAELWYGAHPTAPSRLLRDDTDLPLDAVVAADPDAELGPGVASRFGARLPFLLKILAAEEPLSLQVHPGAERAAEGFAAEERQGIPRDAPERNYVDDWPKPEMLCALTRFDALCGFRPVFTSVQLLRSLRVPTLDELADRLSRDGEQALSGIVASLLGTPRERRRALVADTGAAAASAAGDRDFGAALGRVAELARRRPDDPGVVVSLLLEHVRLEPGEAIALDGGNLHAYLRGTGVELMAASDNVLRGGLTDKHVDVEEFLAVLDPAAGVRRVGVAGPGDGGQQSFEPTAEHFRLARVTPAGEPVLLDVDGPSVLLCTHGRVTVHVDGRSVALEPTQAAFVSAAARTLAVDGHGQAFRAAVGEPACR